MTEKETNIPQPYRRVVEFLKWQNGISPLPFPSEVATVVPRREDEMAAVLREAFDCQGCRLGKTRTKLVFGDGNLHADIMFVGEGPGEDEDLQGIPFVGRAGQLLTKIIENGMKIPRSSVYIANIVKCRPPENREPLADEAAACIGYLRRQIAIIRPRAIVLLGKTALRYLLGHDKMSIREARERTFDYEGIPVFVTYHPSALLRNPDYKRPAWEDIKRVMRFLGIPVSAD